MSKLIARAAKQAGPAQGEVWTQYLQRRVMRLLLLHDQQLFRGQFRAFFAQSALPKLPLLQFYDRYIRLQLMGEELLALLPDIRSRLSLQIEYELFVEEMPTREIDWPPTIERAINETPDQPPLRFDTRQSRQNLAIPENLLVVAILLEYQQTVQDVLRTESQQETLNEQELQALRGMEEQIERELAAPYAQALREAASHVEIDSLLEQVIPRLKPGANPYRDLISWWENFRDLHIGRTLAQRHLTLANNRNNEQIAGWLYELWIALEILDLLHDAHLIVPETVAIESERLQCLFTWNERRVRFRYQRQLAPTANGGSGWQGTGTPISSYAIEREVPEKIEAAEKLIWQEPPIMLSASYVGEQRESTMTQQAIQQLLGGMQLAGTHNGSLFSPALPEPPEGRQWSELVQPDGKMYTEQATARTSLLLYKITPDMGRDLLRSRLRAALNDAVEAIPEQRKPACYGILLDTDSVNASRRTVHSGNVLCPKPHLGPGVFDLVDDRLHCLKDPHLCHVYGQPITPPFVIRVETLSGLEQQNSDLRANSEQRLREAEEAGDETRAEQLRSHIFLGVGRTIEQYVQRHGNTTSIEAHFEDWIFGDYWKNHSRQLSEDTRNNLLSGEYVWEEYRHTKGLHDWAAPAIQYCRALENEIKRRLYAYYPNRNKVYPDVGRQGFNDHMTLGFLEIICEYRGRSLQGNVSFDERKKIGSAQHNWPLCEAILKRAGCPIPDFERQVQRFASEGVRVRRNKLAHGEMISQSDAQALRTAIIGQKENPGILIWIAENLEPKK